MARVVKLLGRTGSRGGVTQVSQNADSDQRTHQRTQTLANANNNAGTISLRCDGARCRRSDDECDG